MAYLVAGPFVALVGIVAVFFVLRRKSVEKRSMYSARRSQIEHKVRAARQRTLTPHGRSKPTDATMPAGADTFVQPQPTMAYQAPAYQAPAYQAPAYEAPAYEAPAAPPPSAPPYEAPAAAPWDMPSAPAAPSSFDYPPASPEPAYAAAPAETFRPAPEPTPMAPSEPAWTPAPEPSAPAQQIDQTMPVATAASASATAAGGWSIVSSEKDSGPEAPARGNKGDATGSWQLASGNAPTLDADDEPKAKRPTAATMAIAQYAVLVVGLVMVLIGVLVMVANSHVT